MESIDKKEALFKEVIAISKYLYNKQKISNTIATKYVTLHQYKLVELSKQEQKLMKLCIKHKLFFLLAECGLRQIAPDSSFYKKIYYTSVILETSPEYYNFYISDKNNSAIISIFEFTILGFWAICKNIVGYIFIKIYLR